MPRVAKARRLKRQARLARRLYMRELFDAFLAERGVHIDPPPSAEMRAAVARGKVGALWGK